MSPPPAPREAWLYASLRLYTEIRWRPPSPLTLHIVRGLLASIWGVPGQEAFQVLVYRLTWMDRAPFMGSGADLCSGGLTGTFSTTYREGDVSM